MRRQPRLTATALGALLLLAAAPMAGAQQRPLQGGGSAGSGYGFDPSAGTPLTPHGQGGAGLIPPVERQYEAARQAGGGSSVELLRSADRALESSNPGLANEQLERAATALLNQPGIEAGRDGVRSIGPGQAINEARAALARNDIPAARRSIREALAAIRQADGTTGTGARPAPQAQGGSAGAR